MDLVIIKVTIQHFHRKHRGPTPILMVI